MSKYEVLSCWAEVMEYKGPKKWLKVKYRDGGHDLVFKKDGIMINVDRIMNSSNTESRTYTEYYFNDTRGWQVCSKNKLKLEYEKRQTALWKAFYGDTYK